MANGYYHLQTTIKLLMIALKNAATKLEDVRPAAMKVIVVQKTILIQTIIKLIHQIVRVLLF